MRTTPEDKARKYAAQGWWTGETLETIVRDAVSSVPDRLALVDPPDRADLAFGSPLRLTYRELDEAADRLGAQLHRGGLRQGDCVLVQLPNLVELVLVYLAAARLGLIVSPLPMQYGTHELRHAHDVLGAGAYLSLLRFKNEDFAAKQGGVLPEHLLKFVFGAESASSALALDLAPVDPETDRAYRAYVASIRVDANDIFTICWTSGTTGLPKGVPRSFNHWLAQTIVSEDATELNDGAVMLNPFPFVNMASIGGFLFLWFRRRATLILHHPFNPPVFLGQIQDERVEYTVAPPALLSRLLQQPEVLDRFDLSSLRCIGSGSAPVPAALVEQYKSRLGIDVINIFGSNEGICLLSAPNDVTRASDRALYFPRFGAAGMSFKNRAGRFLRTRLVDLDTGEEIDEPGRPGEMRIDGPTVFDGYYDAAGSSAEAFDERGYFRTGDLFEIVPGAPEQRFYRFCGRCKDIIVRGGMKISPEELDILLEGFPGLLEAAFCGVSDEDLHERVGIVVVPAEAGAAPELEQIVAHLEAKGVARFKWPERIAVADALPRNSLNKVLRRDLAKLFSGAEGG